MKLLFLGTGASLGTPVLGCDCAVCRSGDPRDIRLRTSVFIEANNESFLIDPGPDFRQQCLKYGITRIDNFLITHSHNDHIGGLDETRAIFYAMDQRPLQFYAESFTVKTVRKYYDYLFPEDNKPSYHGAPQSEFHNIKAGVEFQTANNKILPLRAFHGSMPVTGFKIQRLVYLTDVKTVPEVTERMIDRETVLVLGALHVQPHALHFNLQEALEFVAKTQPERAYLTHISHWMGRYEDVTRRLPENVMLAHDGLEILI